MHGEQVLGGIVKVDGAGMLVAVEGVQFVGQSQFFQQLLAALVEVVHPGRHFPRLLIRAEDVVVLGVLAFRETDNEKNSAMTALIAGLMDLKNERESSVKTVLNNGTRSGFRYFDLCNGFLRLLVQARFT